MCFTHPSWHCITGWDCNPLSFSPRGRIEETEGDEYLPKSLILRLLTAAFSFFLFGEFRVEYSYVSICHSYVLVCYMSRYPYVLVCFSYVARMLPVCTRTYSYVIRMYSCIPVCHSCVTRVVYWSRSCDPVAFLVCINIKDAVVLRWGSFRKTELNNRNHNGNCQRLSLKPKQNICGHGIAFFLCPESTDIDFKIITIDPSQFPAFFGDSAEYWLCWVAAKFAGLEMQRVNPGQHFADFDLHDRLVSPKRVYAKWTTDED